jgi:hypothetical protein
VKNIHLGEGYKIGTGTTTIKVDHTYTITWWDASSKTWKTATVDANVANITYLIEGEWKTYPITPSQLEVSRNRLSPGLIAKFDPDDADDFLPNIIISLHPYYLTPREITFKVSIYMEGSVKERQYAYKDSYVEIALSLPNHGYKISRARLMVEPLGFTLKQYYDENGNYVIVLPLPKTLAKTGKAEYIVDVMMAPVVA